MKDNRAGRIEKWKPTERLREETMALREVRIIGWALGLTYESIPTKVTNPNDKDMERMVGNSGVDNFLKKKIGGKILKAGFGGLADPVDNRILDMSGRQYPCSLFGVSWEEVLAGVTDASLHEAGHLWFYKNIPPEMLKMFKRVKSGEGDLGLVESGKEEKNISAMIVSEGVATYIAKRCNDFIRGSMVDAVAKAYPGDSKKRERCADVYEAYYDASHIDGGQIEEDFGLVKEAVVVYKKSVWEKIRALSFVDVVEKEIVYRLGYNLINRMVDIRRESGMTEAEALLDIVANPPVNLEEIGLNLEI